MRIFSLSWEVRDEVYNRESQRSGIVNSTDYFGNGTNLVEIVNDLGVSTVSAQAALEQNGWRLI